MDAGLGMPKRLRCGAQGVASAALWRHWRTHFCAYSLMVEMGAVFWPTFSPKGWRRKMEG